MQQLQYAGMAAFSLATLIVGAGVFSQEALAATRTVEELGALERVGAAQRRWGATQDGCSSPAQASVPRLGSGGVDDCGT